MNYCTDIQSIFKSLNLALPPFNAQGFEVNSPVDGRLLAKVTAHTETQISAELSRSYQASLAWRKVPAPKRGELVRVFGELVRQHKEPLGQLISHETGKILQEGWGEVQEVVDICEFAVGLSRQLYGLSIASERPDHKLLETWHPLGAVGIISAFNFPMAVFAWNAALALVCGNTIVWKPSEKAPLSAMALTGLLLKAAEQSGMASDGLVCLLQGNSTVGKAMVESPYIKLVSATGSTAMGRQVAMACATTFKKSLLELGGNNAAIVCPSANLELVTRGVVFSAAGTAGQRCTTLRRLIVHRSVYQQLISSLQKVFEKLPVGNPLTTGTLVGPLIDQTAYNNMQTSLEEAKKLGAKVHFGSRCDVGGPSAYYVRPAIVEFEIQMGPMLRETFAPILYVVPYDNFEDAIAMNNAASHGLSSSVFTQDLREAEIFTSSIGSDCGIANVNIGTSGAEIGGAFGGEKETGGGRESGSDAWKAYMRRATNTVNYGNSLPLAQGIQFDV
ncbi:MAG: hypothetical protein RL629_1358 [Pseudomonadota bacterium]